MERKRAKGEKTLQSSSSREEWTVMTNQGGEIDRLWNAWYLTAAYQVRSDLRMPRR